MVSDDGGKDQYGRDARRTITQVSSLPQIQTVHQANIKFTGRNRMTNATTMSSAKHEYGGGGMMNGGGGMMNSARDNYRSRTPMQKRTDVSGNRLDNRSGSMPKFKHLSTVNHENKNTQLPALTGMRGTVSMKMLAPSASASTFKNRNLITMEDCAAVFRVIWDGVMNQAEERSANKQKYNP